MVWTTPPGWAELQEVLTCTRPNRLVVFAVDPETDQPQAFLHRLAGLVKYVLSKQDGWATLSGLAAATAQKKWTVRLGLEWLAAMGHITIISTDEEITQADVVEEEVDRIRIVSGGVHDASQAAALLDQIQNLIGRDTCLPGLFITERYQYIVSLKGDSRF